MSKTTVMVCAFIVGTCCGFLLNNRVPIVLASPPNSQASVPQKPQRSIFHGGGVGYGGTGVVISGALPVFRPLESTPIFEDFSIISTSQPLDGLDCRRCEFANVTLRYGGGAYNLENAKFSGTTTLVFEGAAANTVAFLKLIDGLSVVAPPPSLPADKPVEKKSTIPPTPANPKKPVPKIDFTAPFIGPR
jgi:hypothetical protein